MKAKLISTVLGATTYLVASPTALAQFDPATSVPTGQQPDTVAIGDLNGDGARDLAITTDAPDKVSIHFGTGGGGFGAPVSVFLAGGSGPGAIEACNVDGDTDLDLVVTLKNTNLVQVLFNNGSGTFSLGPTYAVGLRPAHMDAADLDGDFDVDIVTSNRDANTLSVLLNTGAGAFGPASTLAVGTDPRGVIAADFTGDGLRELAVSAADDRNVDVLQNLGGGSFGAPVSYSVGPDLRPDGLAAADMDGDLDRDLVAATSGTGLNFVSVFTNTGGVFTGPVNSATGGTNPSGVVAGDFDGDSDMDVATSNSDSANVSVLLNLGGGVLGAPTLFAVGTSPDRIAGGDLDGGGSMDLVTANKDSNSASVLLSQDTGVGTTSCFGVGCPCGNDDPAAACANSSGSGALLRGSGSTSASADNLVLTATSVPDFNQGLFYMGDTQVSNPFFDGFQCALGNSFRFLDSIQNSGASGTMTFTGVVASSGLITSGSTWHFHCWFRDVPGSPCGTGANLSNLLSVTFTP